MKSQNSACEAEPEESSLQPYSSEAFASPAYRPAVPHLFDTRDRFRGSQFFQWRSGRRGGHGFRMFQMHYTYHVLISNLMPC